MTLELTEEGLQRHRAFVAEARDVGRVSTLAGPKGGGAPTSRSNREPSRTMYPFWSSEARAKTCARDGWAGWECYSIPVSVFLERVIPDVAADGALIGTNWNAARFGHELEPEALRAELSAALGPGPR